jgi:hypothetical protein
MHDERLDQPLRLIDAAAMSGEINSLRTLQQHLQRADIVLHIAFRRRHDRGVPPHDMVAGQ